MSVPAPRVLKRYRNRKLYDLEERRFTSLRSVERLVRTGTDVQVLDHATGEDITAEVLAKSFFSDLIRTPLAVTGALAERARRDEELADLRQRIEALTEAVAVLARLVEHDAMGPGA